jgi:hypothetical protein
MCIHDCIIFVEDERDTEFSNQGLINLDKTFVKQTSREGKDCQGLWWQSDVDH